MRKPKAMELQTFENNEKLRREAKVVSKILTCAE